MSRIAMLLVALWGILHRILILGFRNSYAAIVSGVEEDGTRRHTTMRDDIARNGSGVGEASVSGVEAAAAGSVSLSLSLSLSLSPFSTCSLRSYLQDEKRFGRFAVESIRNFACDSDIAFSQP